MECTVRIKSVHSLFSLEGDERDEERGHLENFPASGADGQARVGGSKGLRVSRFHSCERVEEEEKKDFRV